MHLTAKANGQLFFQTYVQRLGKVSVIDIGSQDVNGTLRELCPPAVSYVGVDFVQAKGVDVVLTDPYSLPFPDGSQDIVVSTSCFEHSEMFWLLFIEALRILRPAGLFYLNAPSNGDFHRYPVDCWRFYPDCGGALVTWAKRCGINAALLESYISFQHFGEVWNDLVAVFVKDESHALQHPNRMLNSHQDYYNGTVRGNNGILNQRTAPEDGLKLQIIQGALQGRVRPK